MKYLVQLLVMFSDVLIVLAAIVLFYTMVKNGSILFGFVSVVLLLLTYRTWKDQGGLIAWTRKGRTTFFKNWDDIVRKR